MRNDEKDELRWIVKNIPVEECDKKISELWKKYGSQFCYGTFRGYFKVFNKKIKEMK